MGSNGQTIVNYQGVALPTTAGVTLFDSSVAFPSVSTPPGGSLHLLGLQWFQYAVNATAVGGSVVIGNYSNDKGLTWVTFFTSANIPSATTFVDEIYIGMFKDVQFIFDPVANTSTFSVNMALNPHKAVSKMDPLAELVPSA